MLLPMVCPLPLTTTWADDQVLEKLVTVSYPALVCAQQADLAEIKNGDPFGHDPLVIARTMAQHGIVLVSWRAFATGPS